MQHSINIATIVETNKSTMPIEIYFSVARAQEKKSISDTSIIKQISSSSNFNILKKRWKMHQTEALVNYGRR